MQCVEGKYHILVMMGVHPGEGLSLITGEIFEKEFIFNGLRPSVRGESNKNKANKEEKKGPILILL